MALSDGTLIDLHTLIDEIIAVQHEGEEGQADLTVYKKYREEGFDLLKMITPGTRDLLTQLGLLNIDEAPIMHWIMEREEYGDRFPKEQTRRAEARVAEIDSAARSERRFDEWDHLPAFRDVLFARGMVQITNDTPFQIYVLHDSLADLVLREYMGAIAIPKAGTFFYHSSIEHLSAQIKMVGLEIAAAQEEQQGDAANRLGFDILRQLFKTGDVILMRASGVLDHPTAYPDPDPVFWDQTPEEALMAAIWEEKLHLLTFALDPDIRKNLTQVILESRNGYITTT